jgi:hypothetical protein
MTTSKNTSVTLPDSGVTLQIKRISPMLLVDLRKQLKRGTPKPMPPLQEVLLGDEKVLQPNDAHPDYLAALQDYNADIGQRYIEAIIQLGVECEIDAGAVGALRESDLGEFLPKNDKVVYVSRIAASSERDLMALQNAILGRAQPTEAAVGEAAEGFRG